VRLPKSTYDRNLEKKGRLYQEGGWKSAGGKLRGVRCKFSGDTLQERTTSDRKIIKYTGRNSRVPREDAEDVIVLKGVANRHGVRPNFIFRDGEDPEAKQRASDFMRGKNNPESDGR